MPNETWNEAARAAALERLFRQYSGWLTAMLRRRFGRAVQDPEDLVQETYLRLARSGQVERLRHPQATLMKVAGNLAIDQLRRRAVAARGASALAAVADADADARPSTEQEELALLRAVILELPQPFRDTFLLSRFGNLTHRQIAEHFGVSVRTVEWRMSQALAMCVRRMND